MSDTATTTDLYGACSLVDTELGNVAVIQSNHPNYLVDKRYGHGCGQQGRRDSGSRRDGDIVDDLISGTVTGDNGNPIPGTRIILEDANCVVV